MPAPFSLRNSRSVCRSGSGTTVLPMRGHVRAGLVQMDVLIDMIDPGDRNEVMMLAVRRALFGQLDLVGAFEMIDFSDSLPVERNDVHMFLDVRNIGHLGLHGNAPGTGTRSRSESCTARPFHQDLQQRSQMDGCLPAPGDEELGPEAPSEHCGVSDAVDPLADVRLMGALSLRPLF